MTLASPIGSLTRFASLLALAFVAGGCGADGETAETADPAETNHSTTTQTVGTKPTRVAFARLREGASYAGPVAITVELSRTANDYTLTIDAPAREPYIVLFATGTCAQYTKTRRTGRRIYEETGMPIDSPQGDDPGVRHVVALEADRARALLSGRLTVFADAGGAHGGDFLFCGTLKAVKP